MNRRSSAQRWSAVRREILLFWLVVVSIVPLLIVADTKQEDYRIIAVLGWLVPVVMLYQHIGHFRCPRCGKSFFRPGVLRVKMMIRRCPHCGWEKYKETD